MVKTVRMVIVGAGAREAAFGHPASAGQTPSIESLARAMTICGQNEVEFSLHLIDPRYLMIRNPVPLPSYDEDMKKELQLLKDLANLKVEIVPAHYRRWVTKDTHRIKEFSTSPISDTTEPVIFVSYLGMGDEDEYGFMCSLEIAKTKNYFFVVGLPYDTKCPIDNILEQYFEGTLREVYDVFSGDVIPQDVKYDKNVVNSLMLEGAEFVAYHISVGIFKEDYETPDPDVDVNHWAYQIETPFVKGVITYYGIKNIDVSDRPNYIEFRISAASRVKIVETCNQVISNYMYRNLLLSKSDIDEISRVSNSGIPGFKKIETYNIFIKNLNNLINNKT